MTYDGENRMTAYSGTAGYAYDGNGLRVAKSVSGGTTTVSIFSGSSVLAEYDNGAAPSAPSREYVYGGLGLLAMFSGGTTTYYHQDHLGVRLTTDASGNLLSQQGTFPFGESWYQQGAGNKTVFTSYDRDSESGLDYAMARYYNSTTGTFCSADPLDGSPGDPQSWNRYPYGRNDPINVTDPSGKSWWDDFLKGLDGLLYGLVPLTGGATLPFAEGISDELEFIGTMNSIVNGGVPLPPTISFGAPPMGSFGVPYPSSSTTGMGGPINNLTQQQSGRITCPPWTVILTGVSPKQAHDKSPITQRRSGSGDAAIDPRDFGESDWYQQGNIAMSPSNPFAARKAAFDHRQQEANDINNAQIQITPDWGTATDPWGSKLPSANGAPSGFPTSGPMGGNDIYSPSKGAHGHIDTYGWLTDRLAKGSTRRVTVNISLIPTGNVRCPH
jgi:RHS repeat-associated protein